MFLAILIAWNVPILREVIAGLKVCGWGVHISYLALRGRDPRALPSCHRLNMWGTGSLNLHRPQRRRRNAYHGLDEDYTTSAEESVCHADISTTVLVSFCSRNPGRRVHRLQHRRFSFHRKTYSYLLRSPADQFSSQDVSPVPPTILQYTDTSVHIVASKVAALVIHFGLLAPILRADHWV